MNPFRFGTSAKSALAATVCLAIWLAPTAAQAQVQPPQSLYMLSVGVSQYQNPGMNLQSAAKDAADMGLLFNAQKGKLFSQVEVTTLTNATATAANIRNALNSMRLKVNPYSYVIVYLAGHGENGKDGDFAFNPYDFHPFQKEQTSITWRQIQQSLTGMPGKVIVILDSCRSGAVNGGSDLIVMSSALAHQNAGENHMNGWFTQALIEALGGKADSNHNGTITLAEIDAYVSERVEQLSFGKQQITMFRPPNVPSTMPLASLKTLVAVNPNPPAIVNSNPPLVMNPNPPVSTWSGSSPAPIVDPVGSIHSSGPIDRPPRALPAMAHRKFARN